MIYENENPSLVGVVRAMRERRTYFHEHDCRIFMDEGENRGKILILFRENSPFAKDSAELITKIKQEPLKTG